MDSTRYRAFLECVEHGSLTAAAEVLGYTPSAVSQLITSMENDFGLKLLRRTKRGVELTSEGLAMLPSIRAYVNQESELFRQAAELNGVMTGRISIATYPSVAVSWLPEVVRRYKKNYPGIEISILECIREDIVRHFERNEADIAFLAYSEPMPYEWVPLNDVEVVAAVPEDHPYAGAKAFPIKECENYDFILGSWGKEPEMLAILERNKVKPVIKYTTYDTPATLAMVRMGLGISLVNDLSAQYWNEHLVKLPLEKPEHLTFGIAYPASASLTNAARKFIEYTKEYFDK